MMAAFVALGYDSFEMEDMFSFNVSTLFTDARFGLIGAAFNLYRKMGAHPANKLMEYFHERICNKFGNPELTFQQLYQKTGRELCLTTVSLNRLGAEYLHVKTTPDMPIALAIRASTAVPGLMMPIRYKVMSKEEDVFVDGGVLHNYPIDCFDGWYLSLDQENSFLRRFHDALSIASDRFAGNNEKTIGAVLYSENEAESFKTALEERANTHRKAEDTIALPDTKRSRKRSHAHEEKSRLSLSSRQALAKFVAVLNRHDKDQSGTISRQEFKESLEGAAELAFTCEDAKLLFGSDSCNPDAIFDLLDINGNGEIEFDELMAFAEKKGVDMMEALRGFERQADFSHVTGLFSALVETLVVNANRISFKNENIDRTIGINTGYLGSTDFLMEPDDRKYIIQCGKMGTIYFLREYIKRHNLQKKTDVIDCEATAETVVSKDGTLKREATDEASNI
ncbi:uncharacterized protein LOC110977509 isoform X2 [Acanthaster planci]|nr:uncharacterized protein LOC110977509 isoform X2 [Acanthaster planci]